MRLSKQVSIGNSVRKRGVGKLTLKLTICFAFIDPQLSDEQRQELVIEVARIEKVYQSMMEAQPLDFSNAPVNLKHSPASLMVGPGGAAVRGDTRRKREYISLMREFADVRSVQADDSQDHFLDVVFGLGEVVEVCGLAGTGKT